MNDLRMSRGDAQQRERRPLRPAPALLPVAQRVNGDAERLGEPGLGEADEPTQCDDIVTSLEAARCQALSLRASDGPREVVLVELADSSSSSASQSAAIQRDLVGRREASADDPDYVLGPLGPDDDDDAASDWPD